MSNICPECFGTPKSNCLLPRCPYRRRALDAALDCFTAESQPATRIIATGNATGFTAIAEDYLEDYYILTGATK